MINCWAKQQVVLQRLAGFWLALRFDGADSQEEVTETFLTGRSAAENVSGWWNCWINGDLNILLMMRWLHEKDEGMRLISWCFMEENCWPVGSFSRYKDRHDDWWSLWSQILFLLRESSFIPLSFSPGDGGFTQYINLSHLQFFFCLFFLSLWTCLCVWNKDVIMWWFYIIVSFSEMRRKF